MRIAIISDIHEDLPYLQRVLYVIQKQGADQVVCLGDISGFSVPHQQYLSDRSASGCLNLLREHCSLIVAGNHDYDAMKSLPEIHPYFDFPENWHDLSYPEQKALAGDLLWYSQENELNALYSREEAEFLKTLPAYTAIEVEDYQIGLSHYLYPNLNGMTRNFYNTFRETEAHRKWMQQQNYRISIAGHRHYRGLVVYSGRRIRKYAYNRKHQLQKNDIVMCPPVCRNQKRSGFCIFDSEEGTIISKGIR